MSGWISVHRKIRDHWLWDDKPFSRGQAWIDLLMLVNHEDNRIFHDGELKDIKRGQRILSMEMLQNRWGWSNTKVKRFLNLLEKDKMINLKIAPRKYTLVTIENYNNYQDDKKKKHHRNTTETPQNNQEDTTETPQKHINNNDNNDNNDNNVCMYDEKVKKIVNLLEENIGVIPPILVNEIGEYVKDFNEDMFSEAIKIAANQKKRNVNYVLGILRRWRDNNIFTISDIESLRKESEIEREEKKKTYKQYNSRPKTKFHNFDQRTNQYSEVEIDKKIDNLATRKRKEYLDRLKNQKGGE